MTRMSLAALALTLTCAFGRAQDSGSHAPLPWGDRTAQEMALQFQRQLMHRSGQLPAGVDPKKARELVDLLQGKDQAEWTKLLQDRPDLQQAARDLKAQDPKQMQ